LGRLRPEEFFSGMSYKALAYLCPGVIVSLYDSYEIARQYTIEYNGVLTYFNHYSEKYVLTADDSNEYALLLDDAYVEGAVGTGRYGWDRNNYYSKFEHFSIKGFPGQKYVGNIYYQAFKTKSLEFRVVSRDTRKLVFLQNDKLGDCAACRELKYNSYYQWDSKFVEYYMQAHEVNCVTRKRQRNSVKDNVDMSLWHAVLSSFNLKFFCKERGFKVYYNIVEDSPLNNCIYFFDSIKAVVPLVYSNSTVFFRI